MEALRTTAGGRPMRSGPWHSVKAHVHHNNPCCESGRAVGSTNRRSGDGGKPLCAQCQSLNDSGAYGPD